MQQAVVSKQADNDFFLFPRRGEWALHFSLLSPGYFCLMNFLQSALVLLEFSDWVILSRDLKPEFKLCGLMPAGREGNITQVSWISQTICSIRTKCHWKLVFLSKEFEIQLINSETWDICEFNILWMLTLTSEEAADSHMVAIVQI